MRTFEGIITNSTGSALSNRGGLEGFRARLLGLILTQGLGFPKCLFCFAAMYELDSAGGIWTRGYLVHEARSRGEHGFK